MGQLPVSHLNRIYSFSSKRSYRPPHKNLPQRLRIGLDWVQYETRTPLTNTIPSPVNPATQYQELNILFANSIDFGVRTGQTSLMSMREVHAKGKVQIMLNLKRKELDIQFPQTIDDQTHNFCFRLPISRLSHIHKTQDGTGSTFLFIPFDRPPQFFVQKKPSTDDDVLFPTKNHTWHVRSTWFRETDVVNGGMRRQMQELPLMDHKGSAIIDIGKNAFSSVSTQANYCRSLDCIPSLIRQRYTVWTKVRRVPYSAR